MALMHFGLPDALANLVTDFCCKGDNSSKRLQRRFKYAWIFKSDGRTNKDFKNVDWWADIDHLQYTLKICQGVDFNPPRSTLRSRLLLHLAQYGCTEEDSTAGRTKPKIRSQPNTRAPHDVLCDKPSGHREAPPSVWAYTDREIRRRPRVLYEDGCAAPQR